MTKTTSLHRVLVIGGGSIGERHIRCFLATGRANVSLCETNVPRLNEIAERYNLDAIFPDVNSALEGDAELAVIATPAHLHVSQAIKLGDSGRHLLIEKPLGLSFESISDLKETIERKKLVAAVGFVYRCHPALQAMRDRLIAGEWGRPLQMVTVAGQNFPTYRPCFEKTYFRDRATGGGAIQDALPHLVDVGNWLIGQVSSLVADSAHLALPYVDVEDTVHVLARHESILASYSLNQHQFANELTISVICEKGMFRFEAHKSDWRWMNQIDGHWNEEPLELTGRDDMYVRQANAFLNSVELRELPTCSLDDGIFALACSKAIYASVLEQKWKRPSLYCNNI